MTTTPDTPAPPDSGPLAGIRVVEMGTLIAGPFCGQLLGDFGAEVVKVEDPSSGDPMRRWGVEEGGDTSLWWPVIARNKKSVTCNLRTPEGQQLARELIAQADVLVENFRPGTLERWGLDYDTLAGDNPGLVMVRVTGYGQTGPYAERAGFGSVGEAMGGLRYITGDPSAPPSRVGVSIGDSLAGLFSALGATMALVQRSRSGQGQVVDTAIYEAVLAMMEALVPQYAHGGVIRERTGSILPGVAPSNVYPTAEGDQVVIGANRDTVFARLAQAMGRPDLLTDGRYRDHDARGRHQSELDELITEWTSAVPTQQLLGRLHEEGVPAGLLYTARDMLGDEHFRAREAITTLVHRTLGDFPLQNVTPRLSRTPGRLRWLGPELGEHNDEIWGGLVGLDESRRQRLAAEGVV
ncbi:CaiB/BaiF CoA transferase family protein [Ornithinicoccus halotolerans]|uniref:CaiB/BaiF CoA transferase family protein n=1 Tax=Ornithinicoccus halotolerans TaxID=1748220 RepID=UPI0012951653|nr:CoA transferase [Ornithinicoccus halotolerans]